MRSNTSRKVASAQVAQCGTEECFRIGGGRDWASEDDVEGFFRMGGGTELAGAVLLANTSETGSCGNLVSAS